MGNAAEKPATTAVCDIAPPAPQVGKSGKKICCSCPETKKIRDECVVNKTEANCAEEIESHKQCLRNEGFTVK